MPTHDLSSQLGFDFAAARAPDLVEDPPGTWTWPQVTADEFDTLAAGAHRAVKGLTASGCLRPLFGLGLTAVRDSRARIGCDGGRFTLRDEALAVSPKAAAAFLAACDGSAPAGAGGGAGLQRKCRPSRCHGTTAAAYLPGAGTLIVHCWASGAHSLDFTLRRHAFLLDSYRDAMPEIALPASVWEPAYCADKIAYSGRGVAGVPLFAHDGRYYLNTGSHMADPYRGCSAWSIRPRDAWHGPTYSYTEQCAAWDAGRLERGDRRGLVVRARGRLYVLERAATFYEGPAR